MTSKEGETQAKEPPLDTSLTSIQWLQELEPTNLVTSSRDASESASKQAEKSEETEPIAKKPRPSSEQHTGLTPPHCRKPPFSYATLIAFAINSDPEKKMTLSQIYAWIETNFPFFKTAKSAWKNSIRHNLSLRETFVKEKRSNFDQGKGSYWRISPGEEEKLLRTTFRQLRQHQLSAPPTQLNPHLFASMTTKFAPLLPKNIFSGMSHVAIPVCLNMETTTMSRPRQRVILPKGGLPPHPGPCTNTPPRGDHMISAPQSFINDHAYSNSPMQLLVENSPLMNDHAYFSSDDVMMIDQRDSEFSDLLADVDDDVSPCSPIPFHISPAKLSPYFLSPDVSPDEKQELAPSAFFSPFKDLLMSLPGTPLRSSPDGGGYGSLRGLGIPGLTPLKRDDAINLDMSGIDGFLEMS